jgi:hypothetical protein
MFIFAQFRDFYNVALALSAWWHQCSTLMHNAWTWKQECNDMRALWANIFFLEHVLKNLQRENPE